MRINYLIGVLLIMNILVSVHAVDYPLYYEKSIDLDGQDYYVETISIPEYYDEPLDSIYENYDLYVLQLNFTTTSNISILINTNESQIIDYSNYSLVKSLYLQSNDNLYMDAPYSNVIEFPPYSSVHAENDNFTVINGDDPAKFVLVIYNHEITATNIFITIKLTPSLIYDQNTAQASENPVNFFTMSLTFLPLLYFIRLKRKVTK